MRWQIDSPSQRGRAAEHLDMFRIKKLLHQFSVCPRHACMVYREPEREELLQLSIFSILRHGRQQFTSCIILHEFRQLVRGQSLVSQRSRRRGCFLSRMHEHEELILARFGNHFLVANFVHQLGTLEGFLHGHLHAQNQSAKAKTNTMSAAWILQIKQHHSHADAKTLTPTYCCCSGTGR
jgi:hypothetical protein